MIDFNDVQVRYPDGCTALAGVSFQVPAGQFCVILGPSGSGKSTLLRTVNGLVTPTAGRIAVGGVAVERKTLPRLRPTIGMIHQQFGLVDRLSAATNVVSGALPAISLARAALGLFPAHHRRKACELMAAVGLGPEHLRRRVRDMSGGQQQRVGIARAFMLNPSVILADEPVASLDPKISDEVLRLLRDQAKSHGATVLCSLHQIDLARAFSDRIIALGGGRVVFDGPPDQLSSAHLARIYGEISPASAPASLAHIKLEPAL